MENWAVAERRSRIREIVNAVREVQRVKGTSTSRKALIQMFWEKFGISPRLLDKYVQEQVELGFLKVKDDCVEYIGPDG